MIMLMIFQQSNQACSMYVFLFAAGGILVISHLDNKILSNLNFVEGNTVICSEILKSDPEEWQPLVQKFENPLGFFLTISAQKFFIFSEDP